jgi:hypothetical protein
MKSIAHALLTFLLPLSFILLGANAQGSSAPDITFTTVFYDDGGIVYVGMKKKDGDSQVVSFPFPSGDVTRLELPQEVSARPVIGLIPEGKKLVVVTHESEGANQGPILHLYDGQKNEWFRLGQVACSSFTKATLRPTSLTFFCEKDRLADGPKRKRKIMGKSVSFGKHRIFRSGTWRFPEFLLRYRSATLLLEGNAPDWDRLRIKWEGGERLHRAQELFSLPAGNPLLKPNPPPSPIEKGSGS